MADPVLEHRIGDRRIIRLIQKWLKAGILEDGVDITGDPGMSAAGETGRAGVGGEVRV